MFQVDHEINSYNSLIMNQTSKVGSKFNKTYSSSKLLNSNDLSTSKNKNQILSEKKDIHNANLNCFNTDNTSNKNMKNLTQKQSEESTLKNVKKLPKILKYTIQKDNCVLIKTTEEKFLKEDFDVFDFKLGQNEKSKKISEDINKIINEIEDDEEKDKKLNKPKMTPVEKMIKYQQNMLDLSSQIQTQNSRQTKQRKIIHIGKSKQNSKKTKQPRSLNSKRTLQDFKRQKIKPIYEYEEEKKIPNDLKKKGTF